MLVKRVGFYMLYTSRDLVCGLVPQTADLVSQLELSDTI